MIFFLGGFRVSFLRRSYIFTWARGERKGTFFLEEDGWGIIKKTKSRKVEGSFLQRYIIFFLDFNIYLALHFVFSRPMSDLYAGFSPICSCHSFHLFIYI